MIAGRGAPGRPHVTGPLHISMAVLLVVLTPALAVRMVIAWMYVQAVANELQGDPTAVDEARTAGALVLADALAIVVAVVLAALASQRWRHAYCANALNRTSTGMGWLSEVDGAKDYVRLRRVQVVCYLVLTVAGVLTRSPGNYDYYNRQAAGTMRTLFFIQAVTALFAAGAAIALTIAMRRMTHGLTAMLDGGPERVPRDRWAAFRGLTPWQTMLAALPLVLMLVGGAIGGGIGGAAMAANVSLARKRFPTVFKAIAMIGIVALAFAAEFAVVAALRPSVPQQVAAPQKPAQPPTASALASPSPPTILAGVPAVALNPPTVDPATGVKLSWAAYTNKSGDPTKDLSDYLVYRDSTPSLSMSASTLVSSVPANLTSFVDSAERPLTPTDPHGDSLYYMVVAQTVAGLVPGLVRPVRLPRQIVIPAVAANTLSAVQPTSVLTTLQFDNGPEPWVVVGDAYTGPADALREGVNHAVFAFGTLSAIPAGSQITEANLSLWQEGDYDLDVPYQVHALTRSFTGSQATWNRASNATAWSHPGADYGSAAGMISQQPNPYPSQRYFDATAIVRGWLASPTTEHGLLVKGVNETAVQLCAYFDGINPADPAHNPSLIITYLPNTR